MLPDSRYQKVAYWSRNFLRFWCVYEIYRHKLSRPRACYFYMLTRETWNPVSSRQHVLHYRLHYLRLWPCPWLFTLKIAPSVSMCYVGYVCHLFTAYRFWAFRDRLTDAQNSYRLPLFWKPGNVREFCKGQGKGKEKGKGQEICVVGDIWLWHLGNMLVTKLWCVWTHA